MKRRIKIGVAGCGSISQIMHLPHLSEMEEFEITSLCDLSPSTLKAISGRFNVKNTFTDYGEFLRSDIEAVLIAVGSSLHPEMAIQAADNGKDVITEKDMCLSLQETEKIR